MLVANFAVGGLFVVWGIATLALAWWMHRRAHDTEEAFVAERSVGVVVLQWWLALAYTLMGLEALTFARPGDAVTIEWARFVFYVVAQTLWMQTLVSVVRVAKAPRRVARQLTLFMYAALAIAAWSASGGVRLVVAAAVVLVNALMWVYVHRWTWNYSERTRAIGIVMALAPLATSAHVGVWLLGHINYPLLPRIAETLLYAVIDLAFYAATPVVVVVSRMYNTCKEREAEQDVIWTSGRHPGWTQHGRNSIFGRVDSYREQEASNDAFTSAWRARNDANGNAEE